MRHAYAASAARSGVCVESSRPVPGRSTCLPRGGSQVTQPVANESSSPIIRSKRMPRLRRVICRTRSLARWRLAGATVRRPSLSMPDQPRNVRSLTAATAIFWRSTHGRKLPSSHAVDRRRHALARRMRPHIDAADGRRSGRTYARVASVPGPDQSSSRFAKSGDNGPPCGVPSCRATQTPCCISQA